MELLMLFSQKPLKNKTASRNIIYRFTGQITTFQLDQLNTTNIKTICPTNGYIRDHDIKYLLRRQPANTLCHGPADPWRWAAKFTETEVCIAAGSMRADARTGIKL